MRLTIPSYMIVHLLDIEWHLSTLFDASLYPFGRPRGRPFFFLMWAIGWEELRPDG